MPTCPFKYPKNFEYHPLPRPGFSLYNETRRAIARKLFDGILKAQVFIPNDKQLIEDLKKFRMSSPVIVESTARPLNNYDCFVDLAKGTDKSAFQCVSVIWDEEPDFLATGFPDFLPGSGK